MARYNAILTRSAASLTLGVGSIEAPGSAMRRFRLYEYTCSSGADPGDNTLQVDLLRTSTASTGTSVTPSPLVSVDAASVTVSKKELTANGTTGDQLDSIGFNQRGMYRWFALPECELVVPATANAGLVFKTPVANNLPSIIIVAKFEEL